MRKLLLVFAIVLLSGCIVDPGFYPMPGVYGGPILIGVPGPGMGSGHAPGGPGRMGGGRGGMPGGGFHR